MKLNPLVLITFQYPYYDDTQPTEYTFLKEELEHLKNKFNPLILVPSSIGKNKIDLPKNIILENSLAHCKVDKTQKINFYSKIFSLIFFKNLFSSSIFKINKNYIHNLLSHTNHTSMVLRWVSDTMKKYSFRNKKVIFYTFWLTDTAVGISLAKKRFKNLIQISRAHSGDIYADSSKVFYSRKFLLKYIDKIFFISDDGRNYFRNQYPWAEKKLILSRIGVQENKFNTGSKDGLIRIVSCSYISQRKRLDLMGEGIIRASSDLPEQIFEWNHFGGGPLTPELNNIIDSQIDTNVKITFHGNCTNEFIKDFYAKNPIDLFISVSKKEGLPVAIMEAVAAGIPIIATNVGGCREIVSNDNGHLLGPNPSSNELAEQIVNFSTKPEVLNNARFRSKKRYEKDFNASINYLNFIKQIEKTVNNIKKLK